MSPAAAYASGLALAFIAAAAWIAHLWTARQSRYETREGLGILSAMRWRELSNLVVDALAASGFERESADQQRERGSGDVCVYRDGRPWVLTCRQGLAHVVTASSAEEFLRSVRLQQAAGGLIVTPGHVEPQARLVAPNVELVDGAELWKLVGPLLPSSVHAEIGARARARVLRATGTALAAATVGGLLLGFALSQIADDAGESATTAPPAAAVKARPATTPAASAAPKAPMSEDEEREAIVREIAHLPGVDRALWSTHSTLQVFLNDPTVASDSALCAVMKRYELLRASRLQIQSPAGAERPVRFMQCAVY
ncbi:restriction endonuclease [Lysobacter xanthus]